MPSQRLVFFLSAAIGLPTILTFFSLLHTHPRGDLATEDDEPSTGIGSFFSFHTPSTLFPPSAIISLTDDNSTFFLARPADFGPSLKSNGISGQLWIGSGFGQDVLGRSGAATGLEGELGCSDVPGWDERYQEVILSATDDDHSTLEPSDQPEKDEKALDAKTPTTVRSGDLDAEPSEGDGTDDYLHHPLPSSPVSKPTTSQRESEEKGHADIQSLQESAEMTGKVALLSRGGCGFLEKVKWAQRRGATALIIGDHTRGGALVTMYARGDTSNISIPSVFTSHTTAHLLSSLIPEEHSDFHTTSGDVSSDDKPTFTPGSGPRATSTPKISRHGGRKDSKSVLEEEAARGSWRSFFRLGRSLRDEDLYSDSRRPPSSGQLDLSAEQEKGAKAPKAKEDSKVSPSTKATATAKVDTHLELGDDFVIGIQDWRDPDLVLAKSQSGQGTTSSTSYIPLSTQTLPGKEGASEQQINAAFTGGSITPGSGEYSTQNQAGRKANNVDKKKEGTETSAASKSNNDKDGNDSEEEHKGLWVTITPTTMSTSPFFDTLLVLVVSPMVTLTVVYALLLLRSRIRRRRWRAPKSVVDRLPIRTYHTMSRSSTASSTRFATPQTSSPTSPLLQSSPRSVPGRSRPRSATASAIGDAVSASLDRATSLVSNSQNEKTQATAQKRKKYHGRQVECVVCLEEYVDGHSRVMSLPCGHEFHAECM